VSQGGDDQVHGRDSGSTNATVLALTSLISAVETVPLSTSARLGPCSFSIARQVILDDFAFEVDDEGTLCLTDDGKEVLDEALFLASGNEARRLPGFRCSIL